MIARRGRRAGGTSAGPVALAALTGVVVLLAAAGALPRWPGLLHLVGLPPLGLVGDLGILLVHAPSIPTFVAGALLSLGVRSVVLAALLGRLDRSGVGAALRFHLAVWPFALLAAGLLFAAKATLFYALFWSGVAAVVVLLLLSAATPWQPPPSLAPALGAAARRGFRAGTLGAYLLGLTVLGALADLGGGVAAVGLVPVSAALTLVAVRFLRADPGFVVARRALAAVPAGGVAVLAGIVVVGPAGPPLADTPPAGRDGSLMVMSGIDSSSGRGAILEIDPGRMGWTCDQTHYYSYAGPGDGQPRGEARCPITSGAPYQPRDTLRSRTELLPFLVDQVAEMDPPAVLAVHSLGVWMTWDAAASGLLPEVEAIALVGAFARNPVSYPAAGERAPGRVGRLLLAAVEAVSRPGGTSVFEADSPLGREWLGHPDAIERTLARPLPPDVRALSVPSTFDLPLMPGGHRIDGATNACPVAVVHPNLPYAAELQETLVRFVDGRPLPACPRWREAVGPLFRHFAVAPSHR